MAPAARVPDERGAASVELALWLPVLLLLVLAATSVAALVVDYGRATHLSASAARYATRSAVDPERPGDARLRPTSAEVDAYVRRVARVDVREVEVSPDPSRSFPGSDITVRIRSHTRLGPLAHAANGVFALLHQSPLFPDGGVDLTTVVTMREE